MMGKRIGGELTVPRRDFIKLFGVSLGSLLLTRCQRVKTPKPTETPFVLCYEMVIEPPPTEAFTPTPFSARNRLRLCWLRFGELAQKTAEDSKTQGTGWEENPTGKRMIADHRAALDELTAAGGIDAPVAGLVQEAYEAAVYHIWRSNAPMTCYDMAMPDYVPASADNLVNQAEALAGINDEGTVPPETLEKVRTALEHDLAFYALTDAEVQALYDQLVKEYGDPGETIPSFEEVELAFSPEVKEAAQFMVDLLTGS